MLGVEPVGKYTIRIHWADASLWSLAIEPARLAGFKWSRISKSSQPAENKAKEPRDPRPRPRLYATIIVGYRSAAGLPPMAESTASESQKPAESSLQLVRMQPDVTKCYMICQIEMTLHPPHPPVANGTARGHRPGTRIAASPTRPSGRPEHPLRALRKQHPKPIDTQRGPKRHVDQVEDRKHDCKGARPRLEL
jgi:hypothetical protein